MSQTGVMENISGISCKRNLEKGNHECLINHDVYEKTTKVSVVVVDVENANFQWLEDGTLNIFPRDRRATCQVDRGDWLRCE